MGESPGKMEGIPYYLLILSLCSFFSPVCVRFGWFYNFSSTLFHFLFRQNVPGGTISGRQLGEAAHRLVVNSLQVKGGRNGFEDRMQAPPPYPPAGYGPPLSSYSDSRYHHHQDHHRVGMARPDYPDQTYRRPSNPTSVRNHFDQRYDHQPYAPSATGHHNNRSHQYERNNRSPLNSDHPAHGYHPQPGYHHNGGARYHHPRQVAQTHIPAGANLSGQEGYNSSHRSYQSYGASSHHEMGSGWTQQGPRGGYGHPQGNPRGYGHPQQYGNQYSVLDRRSNRGPPPPGYDPR